MVTSPPRIDLLPEHLIDQIKAGEVIERPGNLIKEILENAIDAGATRLELTVQNNGLDLIALKDNGHGMRFADLPVAFSRHATSKIRRFEDLYQLHSFGFRGEALASIAAVSRLQCVSYGSAEAGAEIRFEGGVLAYHGERANPTGETGTELVIQDLFFNTPARLKFIQGQQAEKQFIRKVVFAFVLAHPEVEFQLKLGEEDKQLFPITPGHQERLEQLLPRAQGDVLGIERGYESVELKLLLAPGRLRSPVRLQHVFINGRFVLDKQIQRVLCNALQATFGHDDYHWLAFFRMPPDTIDVNVHPNKTIIKCADGSRMLSLLTSTVKELGKELRPSPSDSAGPGPTPDLPLPSMPAQLSGQRQAYDLEGRFSPHGIQAPKSSGITWLGNFFLQRSGERWLAVSAPALLEAFVELKLQGPWQTVPLLVSEPFPKRYAKAARVQELAQAGLELEELGPETLVLRSVPHWMSAFPLRPVVERLLQLLPLRDLSIDPAEWASSTWEEMLAEFPADELLRRKIGCDLQELLREKLR
jgi:DNA mismatch repair protein MutL